MNTNLWSIFRNADGGLDGAMAFPLARKIYDGECHVRANRVYGATYTAVRRGPRGRLQVRDLATGLLLDHAEAVPHLRRLEKLNPRLHNLV